MGVTSENQHLTIMQKSPGRMQVQPGPIILLNYDDMFNSHGKADRLLPASVKTPFLFSHTDHKITVRDQTTSY